MHNKFQKFWTIVLDTGSLPGFDNHGMPTMFPSSRPDSVAKIEIKRKTKKEQRTEHSYIGHTLLVHSY